MGRPKKVTDDGASIYDAYIHGEPINNIALRFKLEAQEVVNIITNIEQNRK